MADLHVYRLRAEVGFSVPLQAEDVAALRRRVATAIAKACRESVTGASVALCEYIDGEVVQLDSRGKSVT